MQAQRAQTLFKTLVTRTVTKRNYQAQHPMATYNDLPSPQGSWQTHHEAQQRKYNAHLIGGIAFFGVTMLVAKMTGSLYLNYSEPDMPAEEISY